MSASQVDCSGRSRSRRASTFCARTRPVAGAGRFRNEAGLEPKAEYYGGWEVSARSYPDRAGHIHGFYLSGASMMYEATNDGKVRHSVDTRLEKRGIVFRQETAFPYGAASCVKEETVGKDAKFPVKVRHPARAGERFTVYVNGAKAGELFWVAMCRSPV